MLLSIELIAGVLVGLVIATVIMLVLQIRNSVQINKLTFPAYEYVVKQAEHKANEIISLAQKEAREIIAEAEKSGQKAFTTYNQTAVTTQEKYVGTLATLSSSLSEKLTELAQKGGEHLLSVTTQSTETITAREKAIATAFDGSLAQLHELAQVLKEKSAHALLQIDGEVASVFTKLGTSLAERDESYKKQIDTHLTTALTRAEEEIGAYKKARLSLLDTHIERLVEEVTAKVLVTSLGTKEHAELARKALAEAKEHNLL
jgi:F0F1-type ATP synthase membrane subunit b/b'